MASRYSSTGGWKPSDMVFMLLPRPRSEAHAGFDARVGELERVVDGRELDVAVGGLGAGLNRASLADDGDAGPDAISLLPRLAAELVVTCSQVDRKGTARARPHVLDLVDHLVALAEHVQLGRLLSLVRHLEGELARVEPRPCRYARRVGRGDGDGVARRRGAPDSTDRERDECDGRRARARRDHLEAAAGARAGAGAGAVEVAARAGRKKRSRVGTT